MNKEETRVYNSIKSLEGWVPRFRLAKGNSLPTIHNLIRQGMFVVRRRIWPELITDEMIERFELTTVPYLPDDEDHHKNMTPDFFKAVKQAPTYVEKLEADVKAAKAEAEYYKKLAEQAKVLRVDESQQSQIDEP